MSHGTGWSDYLTKLNATLADLYPQVDDSRRVVTMAGLPADSISFNATARINWFNILEAARRHGRVDALVNIARVDFPENDSLQPGPPWTAPAEPPPATTPALTGREKRRIVEALLSGFPRMADLGQLALFELNENLHAIAAPGSLQEVTIQLVQWADARGKVDDLIRAAAQERPENPLIASLGSDWARRSSSSATGLPSSAPPSRRSAPPRTSGPAPSSPPPSRTSAPPRPSGPPPSSPPPGSSAPPRASTPPPAAGGASLGFVGLTHEAQLRMTQVATSIFHLLPASDAPLVSCVARNPGPGPRRLRFKTRIERLSDPAVDSATIGHDKDHEFRLRPTLIPDEIAKVTETTRATVTMSLEDLDNDDVLFERGSDVWILPRGMVPLDQLDPVSGQLKDMTPYLGAFVTPRRREVTSLLRGIAQRLPAGVLLNGYKGTDASVRAQVKATFEALKALDIVYVNTVLAHTPDQGWLNQLVQLPRETLASLRANCVDGMVLIASLLEAVDLNPALVFVPGHAFVGWETWPRSGNWQYLETTEMQNHTFEEASTMAMRQAAAFQSAAADDPRLFRRWDMATLRARSISPLE